MQPRKRFNLWVCYGILMFHLGCAQNPLGRTFSGDLRHDVTLTVEAMLNVHRHYYKNPLQRDLYYVFPNLSEAVHKEVNSYWVPVRLGPFDEEGSVCVSGTVVAVYPIYTDHLQVFPDQFALFAQVAVWLDSNDVLRIPSRPEHLVFISIYPEIYRYEEPHSSLDIVPAVKDWFPGARVKIWIRAERGGSIRIVKALYACPLHINCSCTVRMVPRSRLGLIVDDRYSVWWVRDEGRPFHEAFNYGDGQWREGIEIRSLATGRRILRVSSGELAEMNESTAELITELPAFEALEAADKGNSGSSLKEPK